MYKIIHKKNIPLRGGVYPLVKTYREGIYFSVAAVNVCKLKAGDYLIFMNEGKTWEFARTLDKEEFKLSANGGGKGLWIMSVGLSKMIAKSTGTEVEHQFYLLDSQRSIRDNNIFTLLLKKPL